MLDTEIARAQAEVARLLALRADPDRLIGWREAATLLACGSRSTVYKELRGLPMPRRGRWRLGDVKLRLALAAERAA